jgi:hypothetical protein
LLRHLRPGQFTRRLFVGLRKISSGPTQQGLLPPSGVHRCGATSGFGLEANEDPEKRGFGSDPGPTSQPRNPPAKIQQRIDPFSEVVPDHVV